VNLQLQDAPLPARRIPAWEQALLDLARASSERQLGLAVVGEPADLVGRYQRIANAGIQAGRTGSDRPSDPLLVRRLTGGCGYRVDAGAWVVLMALPRLEELAAVGAAPLTVPKLLNRYVRPFLSGLNHIGARSFYPGRDRLRAGEGLLAMLSFHLEAEGPVLLELLVNAARGSLELEPMADRLGIPRACWPELRPLVCFEQIGAGSASLASFAAAVGHHLKRAHGIELIPADPMDPERLPAPLAPPLEEPACQGCRGTWSTGQLGELWIGARVEGGRLSAFHLRGAFLGAPSTLDAVERSLVGSTLDCAELLGRLEVAGGAGPLLGLGAHQPLVDTIVRASRAGLS